MRPLFVNEFYAAFQGEGATIGKRCWFLRLTGCDLSCEWCDSKYTWHPKVLEKAKKFTPKQMAETLMVPGSPNRIVITGGEPLLQAVILAEFMTEVWMLRAGVKFEIETNGLHVPVPGMLFSKINVSPKISNSGLKKSERYNESALNYLASINNTIFKFVISTESDIDEILTDFQMIPKEKIYLMPQGITTSAQKSLSLKVMDLAMKYEFNFSPRLHILIHGNRRRI